ncbi:hypothetical protein J2S17_001084 [Cytobacillus purgationiresistens]|uniref:Uncharacterized protein n=1 Tax=Cytobacillus purgationiresistens TaxID=863449 RepID=A0ABU0AD97_9BACI|nr:hypothetical protein [Cytobacillus purgationiresistens]
MNFKQPNPSTLSNPYIDVTKGLYKGSRQRRATKKTS